MPESRQRGRPRKLRPAGLSGQLGGRIESLRKERGWSADELGCVAGLGTGTVLRVERGEQSATLDTVLAIAHALGKSGADLLRGCPAWTGKPTGEQHAPPEV
jgi:transcriptional regulator with XRE-family HTH domain